MQEIIATTLDEVLAGKAFPQIVAEGTEAPFITYTILASEPLTSLAGEGMLYRSTVQFSIYTITYAEMLDITQQVINAMLDLSESAGLTNQLTNQQNGFEEEARLHRMTLDFNVWHY